MGAHLRTTAIPWGRMIGWLIEYVCVCVCEDWAIFFIFCKFGIWIDNQFPDRLSPTSGRIFAVLHSILLRHVQEGL